MSEWWTYTPENFLMFSARTYYRLFERHNAALWPVQFVALAVGAAAMVMLWRRPRWAEKERGVRIWVSAVAAGWLLVAWAYFWVRYTTIHTGGKWFAAGFAVQAGLLLWAGVIRAGGKERWDIPAFDSARARAGVCVWGAAVLVYPLIARLAGRPWTQSEVFGLAPDPTVLATLGLLLAMRGAWWLWVVPVGWSLYSAMTLWTLHAPEAWVVLGATIGCVALAVRFRRDARAETHASR